MAKTISAEERVTNLVVALMSSDFGLTKQQILSSVSGYRERNEAGVTADALDKMFERDKDQLRSLGIPIETIGDFADPNDLREARYRIPKSDYELPDDIQFTPEEVAVLQLAGSVWSAGSMSDDAQAGVRKIRALGIDGDEPIIGLAPRLSAKQSSFAPLQDAIERGVAVQFDYLKPGDSAARRRELYPLALVEFESRWHVHGVDLDISEARTFLLSRIVSGVKMTKRTLDDPPREGAAARARHELEELAQANVAAVQITPGTEAALRLSRRATQRSDGFSIPFVDLELFADELASYGPEVRVLSPEALRNAVIQRLRATALAHGGAE